jgi:hypothetical protein
MSPPIRLRFNHESTRMGTNVFAHLSAVASRKISMRTFNCMSQFCMFATLAPASGGSALFR